MKILLLAEACGAGVGRHVIDLAHGLAAAGHEIHLLYSPMRVDRAFVKGFNALRAAHQTIHCAAFLMRRGPHVSDLGIAWRLRQYVRRHGPFDAIHAHSTKAGLLARTALIGLPGAQIYTPHAPLTMNPDLKPYARLMLQGYERSLAQLTQRIIAVSPEELTHLRAYGIPEERLVLVPNGIDTNKFGPKSPRDAGQPLCIGFAGRLAPQKNLPMLFEAFAEVLHTAEEPVVLAIAGAGPMRLPLETLAEQLGIAWRVRWLGECDARVMQTFDIFALSSSYEGLPYVLLESMAVGLPAVCTRVGGAGLLIAEGVNGFTAPVGDIHAFAAGLSTLTGDASLRERMGASARERVSQFSISKMVESTLDAYAGRLRTQAGSRSAGASSLLPENSLESVH